MSNDEIWTSFLGLGSDIEQGETFPSKRPFLAHYTSIDSLEKIMSNDELWFSNPLYTNDLEELRFGINEGAKAFGKNESIKDACGSEERYKILTAHFDCYVDQFSNKHALDTYVFCLAEHDSKNSDGLLSMWRGYGGNGNGAALVFDTEKLEYNESSPLRISKVSYYSKEERLNWIESKLAEFAALLSKISIPDEQLYLPANALFERLKTFALFTKHHGFLEEREWRVVYLGNLDRNGLFKSMLDYTVGRYGIEPKLKFKVQPIEGFTAKDLSLETIVTEIILGPAVSSPLATSSVCRMLEKLGKYELATRVTASTTPFRQ